MKTSNLAQKLERGEAANGIWRTIPDDAITEIIANTGYDFQIFDLEHAALGWADIQSMIRINNALAKESFVRLGDRTSIAAQRALDAGAHGLVYPGIESVEDVDLLLENLNFAPNGRRGFNPFVPAFGYGATSITNEFHTWMIPIIETKAGLLSIKAISSHPSINIIYLGAYDLSVHLGTPGDVKSEVVVSALKEAVYVCRGNKCHVGLMIDSREAADEWEKLGVKVLLRGVDAGLIRKAVDVI